MTVRRPRKGEHGNAAETPGQAYKNDIGSTAPTKKHNYQRKKEGETHEQATTDRCRYCGTFVVPFFVKPGETELLTLSIHAMRLYALSYLVNWIDGCLSGFLTALGQAGRSFVVSIMGTLVLPLAGLAILVPSMGLDGVCLTSLLSGAVSAVLAIVLVMTMKKGGNHAEIESEKHL